MRTIIRINNEDGTKSYVHRTWPTISTTDDERQALRMDFKEALSTSLALGTMKIGHCMISKKEWEPVETKHRRLDND